MSQKGHFFPNKMTKFSGKQAKNSFLDINGLVLIMINSYHYFDNY